MVIILRGQEATLDDIKNQKPIREVPAKQSLEVQSDDHHILIVNGQPKKVAKRSQYMLDMLTIDLE